MQHNFQSPGTTSNYSRGIKIRENLLRVIYQRLTRVAYTRWTAKLARGSRSSKAPPIRFRINHLLLRTSLSSAKRYRFVYRYQRVLPWMLLNLPYRNSRIMRWQFSCYRIFQLHPLTPSPFLASLVRSYNHPEVYSMQISYMMRTRRVQIM